MRKLVRLYKWPLLISAILLILSTSTLVLFAQPDGEVYRVNRRSQWQQWNYPTGTLEFGVDGSLTPIKFQRRHNAALNAADFVHKLVGGKEVQGGSWKVGNNAATATNIIDGKLNTFWQPDPNAPLADWWIEIDLGRATLVTEIRLRFPDEDGARPFQEFRVFGSDGHRVSRQDVYSFHLIGGTTKPISETEVIYNIKPIVKESRFLLEGATLNKEAVTPNEASYDMLQYVRILVDAKTVDAALAEVEIMTIGENVGLQTLTRGGTVLERNGRGFAENMADGDVNTNWGARREKNQKPISWEWDLGALFWVDRIVLRTSDFLIRTLTYGSNLPEIRTHQLSTSDGRKTLTGAIDYDLLFAGDTDAFVGSSSTFPGQITYEFPPRPVRFISADWVGGSDSWATSQSGFIVESIILPTGHVAQIEITSDFIDLGQVAGDNRSKVIKSLYWEADLPAGSSIQARTRSGNELKENIRYFRKDGTEVTAEQYDQMPKKLRGGTQSNTGVGDDWSEWSNFYQGLGGNFLSPSPRRFAQVMLILKSNDPEVAPTVRALAIDFTNALLSGIEGQIQPRLAQPGEEQKFTFNLTPQFQSRDSGFNRILVVTPSLVDITSVALRIDDNEVEPRALTIAPDSLIVDLPETVRRDGVELDFNLVLKDNSTLISAFIGRSIQPGLWQPVDPSKRSATTVLLPSVAEKDQLIGNLLVRSLITPNGDGIGDVAEIRFHVLKGNFPAQVRIYSLDGTLVKLLEGQLQSDQSYLYTWSGDDNTASMVPPGIYLCDISLEAQSGTATQQRLIGVAY